MKTTGPGSGLQWLLIQLAARTGHTWKPTLMLSKLFPSGNEILAPLGAAEWIVPLRDAFWIQVLLGKACEPEVHRVLDAAFTRCPSSLFIDCGANIGYWSVLYSHHVTTIAVEPCPEVHKTLLRNAELNGFQAIQVAVWSEDNRTLSLSWLPDRLRSGSVIFDRGRGAKRYEVEAVTLHSLVKRFGEPDQPVVIKLDVEGAEVEAIRGCQQILPRALLIYEDHGSDMEHETTRYIWGQGFKVFFLGEPFTRITAPDQLSLIKQRRGRGYNFATAHPGSIWDKFLIEMSYQKSEARAGIGHA